MDARSLSGILTDVRAKRPLVHHITNYVTVNDCANVTLCIGAAPVMAHAHDEVAEMVAMAGALVLNIGTLDHKQVDSMMAAGHRANDLDVPIILDPVGAGATRLRTETAKLLLHKLHISVLKGNAGEIATLAGAEGKVRGVDSAGVSGDPAEIARGLAEKLGIVVAVSGATDIVTDGKRVIFVDNGHEMMGKLSGTGCMASSISGAFAAASKDHVASTAAALAAFGVAGEKAAKRCEGPASFKIALLDETYRLTADEVSRGIKVRFA
ncbi:hydroxyethylthiazole kinase [Methanocella sp. MCL-LM]|uniref:hydroxyethylthiazole kinase n=1 Tax=Methanocella sp. MCL-LM TaxID=3412035 RepID=UPI003C76FEC9